MTLIPQIDEQKSRDNARDLLKAYRRLARMAGRPLTNYKSPTIDDMPKAQSFSNLAEKQMIDHFSAEQEIKWIDRAMQFLSFESYWVLYFSYCTDELMKGEKIAERMGYANDNMVDYQKRKALLEFAEAFNNSELLEFT
ncbi:ArpU family phage packaging/lysis transcriptional regulator [Lacticaseibacillus saniviri]|nr:ArpU family phage packaging/lysis transcriptional regulator [Lacticaseibacillus saniviri]MCG4280899.1 autolysin [Lacticaseibacillus saniviri]